MKLINRTLFMALLIAPQMVWAVTPANNSGIGSMPLTNTSGTIERGGTITAVDRQGRTITVDGVTYLLGSGVAQGLKINMQIRFSTTNASGQQKVTAIQIVNTGK